MKATYHLCVLLIQRGKTEGLQDKLDVFYALGRLDEEEYKALTEKLAGDQEGQN